MRARSPPFPRQHLLQLCNGDAETDESVLICKDLLLIYGVRIQTFRRDRLIGTDEVHAEAAVESVLLDVRTGIVIHTAQTAESISAKKAPGDVNFSQTVAKAESEATGKALLKLADAVVVFVSTAGK